MRQTLRAARRDDPAKQTELFANIGLRPKLTRTLILLLAGGQMLRGPTEEGTQVYAYLGLQLSLPDQYSFASSPAK